MPTKNRSIFSNTLLLFVRIFVITLVGLYTLRIVLNNLGHEDYGLFIAINGVVLLSSCLVPVFSLSLQRFYSYYLGKNDETSMKKTYSASINIIIAFLVVLALLFATVGRWFVFSEMIIPEAKIEVVSIIYDFSIVSLMFSILQVPFTACMFANEDMGVYTVVSSVDCVMKLVVAVTTGIFSIDNLVYYCGGLCATACFTFLIYAATAYHRYSECRYIVVTDRSFYKLLLSFSFWTTISSVAGISIIQGSSILLNIFFGPLANAAFGVANNLYNAFNSLSNSVVLAFRPVMIKTYSAGNHSRIVALFGSYNKALCYLLLFVSVPIVIEMPMILKLWLGNINDTTVIFCRMFVAYALILALHNPITTIIQATGNIKNYTFCCDVIMLMHIPLAWLFCRMGLAPACVFVSIIIVAVSAHVIRVICIKRAFAPFNIRSYVIKFVIPATFITIASSAISISLHTTMPHSILSSIVVGLTSMVCVAILIWLIGTNNDEKQQIRKKLKPIVNRISRKS